MNCINCGNETTGNFCSNCGQRTTVKRITFKEVWFDFWSRVYGFDGMFPRTLRDLTLRPGVAALRFIEGNRVLYYGAIGYFFLMITLYLLVLSMFDLDYVDFIKRSQESVGVSEAQRKSTEVMQRLISDNLKLFFFLVIPFEAFVARYIFFRKSGFNFLENTIIPLYLKGHLLWISILLVIIFKVTGSQYFLPTFGSISSILLVILTVILFGLSYASLMTHQSKVKAFFKGIFVYILAQILFIISFTIFFLTAMILTGGLKK